MPELIIGKSFERTFALDRAAIDEKSRTVQLSFSSEAPVERFFGTEVLGHGPGEVDLSRIENGGALLVNHNQNDQIGVVEKASIGQDRKGRATVRFGTSARASEIFEDVKSGIRRLISVGYVIRKTVQEKTKQGVEIVRAIAWTPLEISIVPTPADNSVGIGRKFPIRMNSEITELSTNREAVEIDAIADRLADRVPNIRDLAAQAIAAGTPLAEFRKRALSMMPQVQPVREAQPLAVKPADWQKYSISRAIRAQLPGSSEKLDGFEREMSDELCLRAGRKPEGCWVPQEIFQQRNFVAGTGTLGGMIVSIPNLGDQFIELLRNKAQVLNLGARILNLDNPVTIPRQAGAGATNWVGETVAATLSTGNFTQITLTPFAVSAFQQYSKQLLVTGNPSIDMLIRDDIVQQIGLAVDLAALHGTGSGQPTGIARTTGIGTVLLATNGQALGNSTAYPALVSLESTVATANADSGSLAYLMRPGHRGALRTSARFANSDTPVWMSTPVGTSGQFANSVVGYRAEVSAQIATNLTEGTATTICSAIFFGNWNDAIVAQFAGGATDLVVDPYTLAVNGVVRIIARRWVDIGVRHPASFALLGGILTT